MIGFRETTLGQLAVDHQVEVNTLTGTAGLSVPIRTSPGRESFEPSLSLGYSSGGRNSTFGVGWFLQGVPSIGLDTTRALPTYAGDAGRYVYAGGQQLVPTLREQAGEWRPIVDDRGVYRVQRFRNKTERTFERFERWTHRATGRVHWVVYARTGVVSVFGLAADDSSRIADPANRDQRYADLIVERSDHLTWYPSEGADGFGAAIEIAKPNAPTLSQSSALRTFFSDMTGDGLLDMVRVDSGRVEYWPNQGFGKFGPGVVMEGAPIIESFGEFDVTRLRLVDLDGSGTSDLHAATSAASHALARR